MTEQNNTCDLCQVNLGNRMGHWIFYSHTRVIIHKNGYTGYTAFIRTGDDIMCWGCYEKNGNSNTVKDPEAIVWDVPDGVSIYAKVKGESVGYVVQVDERPNFFVYRRVNGRYEWISEAKSFDEGKIILEEQYYSQLDLRFSQH